MKNVSIYKKMTWEALSFSYNKSTVSRIISYAIVALIVINVFAVILGTIGSIQTKHSDILNIIEYVSVIIFSIEYLLRLWSCVTDEKYSKSISGRLRYLISFLTIIDLIAILPFFLSFGAVDLRVIRIFRLVRIFRLLKLTRYVKAVDLLSRVIKSKKVELLITTSIVLILFLCVSCMLFFIEHEAQPDKFHNILSAMWCAVSTLTFVGNGDIYPITAFGRMFIATVAFIFIGFIGLPASIISAGFIEEIQKVKKCTTCPHCGKELVS
jgi:voltage-gated potassium channel